jgi:gliding motility-associated-like protein
MLPLVQKTLAFLAISLLPLFGFSQYQVNGNASVISCNCYQLTANTNNQSGSVWNTNVIDLGQAFDFTFDVFLGCSDAGADGIVFGLQPIGTGVGTPGGGMGFGGVTPSLGVFVDTYQNAAMGDPVADHLSINSNGNVFHDSGVDDLMGPISLPGNIENCLWHVLRVTWDPATFTMQVYFDGVLYMTYVGDIVTNLFSGNPNVYWGLTGATGGATNQQQFCTQLNTEWATLLPDYSCLGQSTDFSDSTLSFGQINEWLWNFGDGDTSSQQNPSHTYAADGVYDVMLTVTDASGCLDSVEHQVTIATPVVDATATPAAVCPGQDSFLDATLTHPFSGQFNYSWTPVATLDDPLLEDPTATPVVATWYTVTVLDPTTGCSALDSVLVSIIPPIDIYQKNDTSVCVSYNFPAINGINLTAGATYFSGPGGTGTQYAVGNVFSTVGTTTFYLYDDNGSCSDEELFDVTINPLPVVNLGADVSLCPGEQALLDASATGMSYVWSNSAITSTITIGTAGTYWVEVTENACVNSDTIQVTIQSAPVFSLGADTNMCEVPFTITPSAVYTSYSWQDGSSNSTFTVQQPGEYMVTVTDAFGCVGSSSIVVGDGCIPSIVVPNVFTPNGDGFNDFFFVDVLNVDDFNMIILNRWGNVVKEFQSANEQWDGRSPNGALVHDGVYFWRINYSYMEGQKSIKEEMSGQVSVFGK